MRFEDGILTVSVVIPFRFLVFGAGSSSKGTMFELEWRSVGICLSKSRCMSPVASFP